MHRCHGDHTHIHTKKLYSGVQKSETTSKIRDVFYVNLEIIRKSDITRSSLEHCHIMLG
ncbi:hypothetical protein LDENG_00163530 [Lucifuga dentata]|nr:hypothetical protein LDENG_00163530 [Lucifuga dentata]